MEKDFTISRQFLADRNWLSSSILMIGHRFAVNFYGGQKRPVEFNLDKPK
jgi:hypothetical protein